MHTLQTLIEQAFEQRQTLSIDTATPELIAAINEVLSCLDSGQLRVAEKINNDWFVHQWIKKRFSFRLNSIQIKSLTRVFASFTIKYRSNTLIILKNNSNKPE